MEGLARRSFVRSSNLIIDIDKGYSVQRASSDIHRSGQRKSKRKRPEEKRRGEKRIERREGERKDWQVVDHEGHR